MNTPAETATAIVNPIRRKPTNVFSEKARFSTNRGKAAIAARRDDPRECFTPPKRS